MKILISSGIFPNRVLINRGIYNLKQALALKNYCDVRVVAPVPYFPRFMKSEVYAAYQAIPREDDVRGFRVQYPRYFVTPKIFRSLHGIFLFLSIVLKYRRIIGEYRPDIILGYFAYPYGFANVLLGKVFKIPVVTFCRGSDIHSIAQEFLRGKIIGWALRNSAKVFSVSESLKRDITELGVDAGHVAVIPNGIEPERFTPTSREEARRTLSLPESEKLAICVSRLSGEKGIDVLIDAVAHVRTPNFRLVLAGDGPQQEMLEEKAARLGVAHKIVFAGNIPHDDVPVWIAAADVSVLSSRKEGYPNAVVEALACGRPVVAMRVGGVPEILKSEQLGLMVEPGDYKAFAAAIDRALDSRWDYEYIEAAGKKRDWDAVARDILGQFESL